MRNSIALGLAIALTLFLFVGATSSRWTNDTLLFYDTANQETVEPMGQVVLEDEFTGIALDTTNNWNSQAVNSGASAINESAAGYCRMTTGAADDDDVELAGSVIWLPTKNPNIEVRAACNDVDKTAFAIGFSALKYMASNDVILVNTGNVSATDAAAFYMDYDDADTIIRYNTSKANVDGTLAATSTTNADATFHIYRVEIQTDGDADFWLDGEHIATVDSAVTTTTALCPYIGFINHEAAANTMDVDYVRVWAKR